MKMVKKWLGVTVLLIASLTIFAACGSQHALNDTLQAEGGVWDVEGLGSSGTFTCYENNTFDWGASHSSSPINSGTYTLDEENKLLTFSGDQKNATFTNVQVLEDGTVQMENGDKTATLTRHVQK